MTWIAEHAGGDVTQHFEQPGTAGIDPGVRHAETPRLGDLAVEQWDWDAAEWVADLDALRARALTLIDRERVAWGMAALTPGQSVQLAYARKGDEVRDFDTLDGDAIDAMDDAARRARFPWLMAEVDAGGGSLVNVANAVRAGMESSEAVIARIEGKAQVAKAAVRAANDAEAVANAANVAWQE